jgi:uncharacterized membrane protein
MFIFAKFLHILGFTVWVGGMFFAHNALRPTAAMLLEPPQRLPLLAGTLGRFFKWVWLAVALVLFSGLFMMAMLGKPPLYITLMAVLGIVMMLIFGHIFFSPNRKLQRAVLAKDWPAGGAAMAQIRKLVAVNLYIGLITIAVAVLGPLA